MKKRILSILLTVCIVLTMLPTTAFATTQYNVWVAGIQVTSDNKDNITGEGISGTVTYDPNTKTLTLNNATIVNTSSVYDEMSGSHNAFAIYAWQDLNIVLVGENTVTEACTSPVLNSKGILLLGAFHMSGGGSLTVTSGSATISSMAIVSNAMSTIKDVEIFATAGNCGNKSTAIWLGGGITIENSKITATGGSTYDNEDDESYGIESVNNREIHIKSGTVVASGGTATTSQAFNRAPNLTNYTDEKIILAGDDKGSASQWNNSTALNSYKYVSITPVIPYNVWVGGTQVTSANKDAITGDGITGTVTYDPDTKTLTLKDATIISATSDVTDTHSIYAKDDLTMLVTGTNAINGVSVANHSSYAIFCSNSLTIGGTGTLTAIGGAATEQYCESYGIYTNDGNIIIQDTVTVNAAGGSVGDDAMSIGIASAFKDVVITGGEVTASGYTYAILSNAFSWSKTAPTLTNGQRVLVASTDKDGSNPTAYDAAKIQEYKYVKIGKPIYYTIAKTAAMDGSFTVKVDGSEVTKATSGETVTIIPTASNGYTVDTVTVHKTGESNIKVDVTNNSFQMPAYDVTVIVSFKPVGDNPTGAISGKVSGPSDTAVSGATVKIMNGANTLKTTTTDKNGTYSFNDLTYGTYSLVVVRDTVTITKIIKIKAATTTQNVTLPSGSSNTVVQTKPSTPPTAAEGLNELFDPAKVSSNTDDTKGITTNDLATVTGGGSVTVTLTAQSKTEGEVQTDADKIKAAAAGEGLFLLDFTVSKVVTPSSGTAGAPITMKELPSVIEIVVEIPQNLRNAASINVYRVHNGAATKFASTADSNGEYAVRNGNYMHIFAKYFSTYSLGYVTIPGGGSTGGGTSSGGGGGSSYNSYTITATAGAGGSISTGEKVSVREGESAGFTFTPNKGYQIADVLVNGKSVGAVKTYTFTNVRSNQNIYVTFKESNGQVNEETGIAFEDVKKNDWFADAVYAAVNNGWFSGTSKNSFSPNLGTTRGMIATVLWRMENKPTASAASIFQDVARGMYYTDGVNWAREYDVVKGYGNGKFGPQDHITREQVAAILYRYAKFKGYDVSKTASLDGFTDGDKTSEFAKTSMAWAVANNLISGKGNNILEPKAGATRGEVASILTRFDKMFHVK